MPQSQNDIAQKEIDRTFAGGIITSVKSSWTSPVAILTLLYRLSNIELCDACRSLDIISSGEKR